MILEAIKFVFSLLVGIIKAIDWLVRRPLTIGVILALALYGPQILRAFIYFKNGVDFTIEHAGGEWQNFRMVWDLGNSASYIWLKPVIDTLEQPLVKAVLLIFAILYWIWPYIRTQPEIQMILNPPRRDYSAGFVQERMQSGSILEDVKEQPTFQAPVWGKSEQDPVFKPRGQCWRNKEFIITARHVVDTTTEVQILGPLGDLILNLDRFELFEQDIAVCRLSDTEWAKLGMKSSKIATCVPEDGTFAMATAYGRRSMGLVKPHVVFGYVEYEGSTIGGFSGAPYFVGGTVFGMHTGGSLKNVGFDVTYLMGFLSREDSYEWFEKHLSRGGKKQKIRWERSPFDPEEYQVYIKGHGYQRVNAETFWRLAEKFGFYEGDSVDQLRVEDLKENKVSPPPPYKKENVQEEFSFLEKRIPEQAADVPIPPKGLFAMDTQVRFQDHLNPPQYNQSQGYFTAGASANLMPTAPAFVPETRYTPLYPPISQYQSPKMNSGFNGHQQTPARPKNRSEHTSKSIRQRNRGREIKAINSRLDSLAQSLERLSGNITPGGSVLSKPGTSTSGLTTNLILPSTSSTGNLLLDIAA